MFVANFLSSEEQYCFPVINVLCKFIISKSSVMSYLVLFWAWAILLNTANNKVGKILNEMLKTAFLLWNWKESFVPGVVVSTT